MAERIRINICKNCGVEYQSKGDYSKYCSEKCRCLDKLKNPNLTPWEEAELKRIIGTESKKLVSCVGCAYIGSRKCGKVIHEQMSSSSVRAMKYRDERCKQKNE